MRKVERKKETEFRKPRKRKPSGWEQSPLLNATKYQLHEDRKAFMVFTIKW